jgi:hypothetical protein
MFKIMPVDYPQAKTKQNIAWGTGDVHVLSNLGSARWCLDPLSFTTSEGVGAWPKTWRNRQMVNRE